jgi:hypothetical protein
MDKRTAEAIRHEVIQDPEKAVLAATEYAQEVIYEKWEPIISSVALVSRALRRK